MEIIVFIFCVLGLICGFGVGMIILNKSIYVRMQQLQDKYDLLLYCVKTYAKMEPSDIGCNARRVLFEIGESEE